MIYNDEGGCEQCTISSQNALKALTDAQIACISQSKNTSIIAKGDTIFEQGQRLQGVYCISKGIGKLTKTISNGKNQIVRFATQGAILGQYDVISSQETNLSAVALTDIELCFIPKEEFLQPFASNTHFTAEIIQHFYSELKKSDENLVDLAQKNAKQRLIDMIFLFEKVFTTDSEGFIQVLISREEIATMIGIAAESLIRMLSELTKNGFIETKAKRIKILKRKELEKISNEVF